MISQYQVPSGTKPLPEPMLTDLCSHMAWLGHNEFMKFVPKGPIDYKSSLVQVMAWCHQTTSHYLSQCGQTSMSPYGIIRLHWVRMLHNSLLWQHFTPKVPYLGYRYDCLSIDFILFFWRKKYETWALTSSATINICYIYCLSKSL